MDLDSIEGLNEVRPAVYRAALKLRCLQKLCQMHVITLQDLAPVIRFLGGPGHAESRLTEPEIRQGLERLFQEKALGRPGQVIPEAIEQTTRLLFKLYDREESGTVLLRSVETALTALCGDTLTDKHRALFRLGETVSGSSTVSRSGLRVLLSDLSQVPAVVQENHVFGHMETAVRSCFSGVVSAGVCEEVFINWLQSEPRLLLWLSTLYRISASEAVQHRVRCHVCKAFPITGLRYRCVKCVSLHLCQTCFLTEKRSRKHKPSHPILEYCTQPSWKESLASLASSARHVLLPRRFTRREAERRRALSRGESNIDPHSNNSTSLTNDVCLSSKSRDSSPQVNVASKALQTEESQLPERKASVLQKDLHVTQKFIKELQRDKWLLEKEFQVWRAAAQSEHNSLEDRCAELEATMEELSQHNQNLERELRHMQHSLSLREQNNHTSSRIISEGMSVTQSQWSDSPASHDSSNREEEDEEEILEGGQTEEQEVEDHVPREHYPDKEDLDSSLRSEPMDVTFDLISEGAFLGEKEIERSRQYEEEKCGSDDGEDVDEEQQLCDLVQQIRTDLSQHTSTESASCVQHWLLEAAEGVGHSICHLISSTNFRNPPVSPAHDHCFLTYK